MLGDSLRFIPDSNSENGTLIVSGYLRGRALNVNNLVHVPDVGDFQLIKVTAPQDPYPLNKRQPDKFDRMDEDSLLDAAVKKESHHQEMDQDEKIIAEPNPEKQESLENLNIPDVFASEQTWPTEEELKEVEERFKKKKKRVPKGTSSYQAEWIMDSEEESEDDEEIEEDEMRDFEESEINEHQTKEEDNQENDEEDMVELEEFETTSKIEKDLEIFSEDEKEKRKKESEEDLEWPDEVITPRNTPARVRFQKYRGLKSFRTTPWNPKENLPPNYARIYQFQNFSRTKKRVLQNLDATVEPEQYVTFYIRNFPKSEYDKYHPQKVFLIGGLLKYENKISVLHFNLLKHPSCSEVVKAKEELVFHWGFRRYKTRPILSQNNFSCGKHKYERFLHDSRSTVASFYGPITFGHLPVLVFKESENNISLVATGTLMGVDPDRIIVKKIILTGYPIRVYKRHSVIREMFYSPEDVKWYKPVELWTKYGRTGHISEPLGTHGYFKAIFDSQVKQNDTICMSLYKRVFPVWTDGDDKDKMQ